MTTPMGQSINQSIHTDYWYVSCDRNSTRICVSLIFNIPERKGPVSQSVSQFIKYYCYKSVWSSHAVIHRLLSQLADIMTSVWHLRQPHSSKDQLTCWFKYEIWCSKSSEDVDSGSFSYENLQSGLCPPPTRLHGIYNYKNEIHMTTLLFYYKWQYANNHAINFVSYPCT